MIILGFMLKNKNKMKKQLRVENNFINNSVDNTDDLDLPVNGAGSNAGVENIIDETVLDSKIALQKVNSQNIKLKHREGDIFNINIENVLSDSFALFTDFVNSNESFSSILDDWPVNINLSVKQIAIMKRFAYDFNFDKLIYIPKIFENTDESQALMSFLLDDFNIHNLSGDILSCLDVSTIDKEQRGDNGYFLLTSSSLNIENKTIGKNIRKICQKLRRQNLTGFTVIEYLMLRNSLLKQKDQYIDPVKASYLLGADACAGRFVNVFWNIDAKECGMGYVSPNKGSLRRGARHCKILPV